MKLCRFETLDEPGRARSGIYFEGRLYETEALKPIGVHDLSKIRLLPPTVPPTVRCFEDGGWFTYRNSTGLSGPVSQVVAPSFARELDMEIRIAAVVGQPGAELDEGESVASLLGATLLIGLVARDLERAEEAAGRPRWQSVDLPMAIGPFVTTLDELEPLAVVTEPVPRYRWKWTAMVGEKVIDSAETEESESLASLLSLASRTKELAPGDLLAAPPLPLRPLAVTPLNRSLQPLDRLQVTVEGLGTLVFTLA